MRREYEHFFREQRNMLQEHDDEALQEVASLGEQLFRDVPGISDEMAEEKAPGAVRTSARRQRRKWSAMNRLHKDLRRIDAGELLSYPDDAREARAISEHTVEVSQPDGSMAELTLADLVADLEWDIVYALPADAPRRIQRRYALEKTRKQLEEERDKQMGGFDQVSHSIMLSRKKMLHKVDVGAKLGPADEGFAAETMSVSFLKRHSLGHEFDFRVINADPVQDARDKIDFILERKATHRRGVDVELDDVTKHIGIQFTKSKNLGKKQSQIRRAQKDRDVYFDDVVLVSVPGSWAREALQEWVKADRPSGGPEQYLSFEKQEELFKKPLEQMYASEEIDAMWEQVMEGQERLGRRDKAIPDKKAEKSSRQETDERKLRSRTKRFSDISEGLLEVTSAQLLNNEILSARVRVMTHKGPLVVSTTKGGVMYPYAAGSIELAEDILQNGMGRRVRELLEEENSKTQEEDLSKAA